jgi:hypothetical protein
MLDIANLFFDRLQPHRLTPRILCAAKVLGGVFFTVITHRVAGARRMATQGARVFKGQWVFGVEIVPIVPVARTQVATISIATLLLNHPLPITRTCPKVAKSI